LGGKKFLPHGRRSSLHVGCFSIPARNQGPKTTKRVNMEDGTHIVDNDTKTRNMVVLVASDKTTSFAIEVKHARLSIVIKHALEQDPTTRSIPLPECDALTLGRVVDYLNHHKGVMPPPIPKPLRSKHMSVVCADPWDAQYIDAIALSRQADVYALIMAARDLDISSLLHLGCAQVASLLKGVCTLLLVFACGAPDAHWYVVAAARMSPQHMLVEVNRWTSSGILSLPRPDLVPPNACVVVARSLAVQRSRSICKNVSFV
jgi:hypothetical protein